MYLDAIDLEDTADESLAYLVRVQQFDLLGALVEVVVQGDAVAPVLDFPVLRPEFQVNWVSGLEHPVKGVDVNTLCHGLTRMRGQTAR